ncbi:ATP-binding protein [Conexibacter sp. JD483]|uniref:ATP-binding protein n=1 Tax=unclassified Conexibacter TaxID=2627773 RepID=UPI002720D1AC|nr:MULTISPECIES: ATP-binding protein [unclassified Conexibacter]MDO8184084.1 ATP-binding protein [Conexibacter sp. CPCC 205706]MDO8197076.1 ATP-binding protein [Conexibacter sp. CPCC 205762]MDR9371115.1 ATP-binding protein [Conexibacter sp. JD483]
MSDLRIERRLRPILLEALRESRAVALLGARQVGKSTLARSIAAHEHPARFVTLDVEATATAARTDPQGFVAALPGSVVIDEIQRAPNLLLAIKERLDRDPARGQFLLTGSADLLTLPTVADALPGRIDYVQLWPLAQAELHGGDGRFVDALFENDLPQLSDAPIGRGPLAALLATGGFPELLEVRSARGSARFFSSYVASIIGRDLEDVADVHDPGNVERLLYAIAARAGALATFHGLATDLGVDAKTARAHTEILERLFLVRRLQSWHVNVGPRQVKSPKLHVADSGLLAFLRGADEQRIADDPEVAGPLLESFAAMELVRLNDWSQQPAQLFHYRDQKQGEVDVVLERRSGEVAGVEVKAAATVSAADFRGLRNLRDRLGDRFTAGVVLYTGAATLPFGDRLTAVPVSGLWS